MTYKQARAEIQKQAAAAGQVLTPQELRVATQYLVTLWRQQQEVTVPDFSPEAVEKMISGDDAAPETETTE